MSDKSTRWAFTAYESMAPVYRWFARDNSRMGMANRNMPDNAKEALPRIFAYTTASQISTNPSGTT